MPLMDIKIYRHCKLHSSLYENVSKIQFSKFHNKNNLHKKKSKVLTNKANTFLIFELIFCTLQNMLGY